MTPLTWAALGVLLIAVIIGKLVVSRNQPPDDDCVTEEWLRNNRYNRDGDRP
jgi:hypothetical protein